MAKLSLKSKVKKGYNSNLKSSTKSKLTKNNQAIKNKRELQELKNARARLKRASEKYANLSNESNGILADRYKELSESLENKRQSLYKNNLKTNTSKEFDLATITKEGYTSTLKSSVKNLYFRNLQNREFLAENILNIDNVASTLYSGLVSVWEDRDDDKGINEVILDYFNAKDMLEVIEMLEDAGINIYEVSRNSNVYRSVQLQIMEYALTHEQV